MKLSSRGKGRRKAKRFAGLTAEKRLTLNFIQNRIGFKCHIGERTAGLETMIMEDFN
jgi:hypothetical protein